MFIKTSLPTVNLPLTKWSPLITTSLLTSKLSLIKAFSVIKLFFISILSKTFNLYVTILFLTSKEFPTVKCLSMTKLLLILTSLWTVKFLILELFVYKFSIRASLFTSKFLLIDISFAIISLLNLVNLSTSNVLVLIPISTFNLLIFALPKTLKFLSIIASLVTNVSVDKLFLISKLSPTSKFLFIIAFSIIAKLLIREFLDTILLLI